MRTALCSALLLILPPASVRAQDAPPRTPARLEVGLRTGLGLSSLQNSGALVPAEAETSPRSGVVAGVWARVALARGLQLQPELLLAQKGADYDAGEEVFVGGRLEPATAALGLTYVEAPVLVRAAVPVGGLALVAVAGPAAAVKVHERRYVRADGREVPRFEGLEPAPDAVRAFDVGLVVGAGLEVGGLDLEVRYTRGLLDVASGAPAARNGALAVTLATRLWR